MVSSFGVDSAALLHLLSTVDTDVPVVFLDTRKHFPETLRYRRELTERLGLSDVRIVEPAEPEVESEDPRGDLNAIDPDACCDLRKTRPLGEAIKGFRAQITGRKRYQTPDRADMPILQRADQPGQQDRLNPLAFWSAKDVTRYMREHDLPPHPLLARGYLSVGCAPCTTPTEPGEDPRAGRWRDADKIECGIHLVDGKWQPVQTAKTFETF